jgi:phosphoribosylamine--glycine ligase
LPYVRRLHGNVAVKYDGLAGGKGVIVCGGEKEAVAAIERIGAMFGRESRFVVEERLVGQEVSVLGLTDGKDIRLFQPVRDHKRLRDGDEGPNTGGMGAYGPAPDVDKEVARRIVKEVVAPTLAGIQAEKLDYRGCIYFGLMLTAEGPKLLEYNVRFGDPETQVLMPLLSSDLVDLLAACCEARLGSGSMHFHDMSCVAVVLAAAGYPDQVEVGQEVSGLARTEPGLLVFHAGTKLLADGRVVTAGGRVVSVVGAGGDVGEAAEAAYRAVKRIRFAGMQYRADIGRAGQGER